MGLFCFVCHTRSPKSHASCCALYIYGKLLTSKVHWLGLKLLGVTIWKLLIIESIFQWKQKKLKLKKMLECAGNSWCPLEALDKSDLIEFYFTIFRAKVWVLEWMLLLEIQNSCKNWDLEGKFRWAANVFTLSNLEIFNYENVKKLKNVFGLGPKAQATIMYLKTYYYMLCILLDL